MDATSRDTPTPRDTPPRRILLVATRRSTLIAVQRALRADRSVELRFYAHCAAALRSLPVWRPDTVLLDLPCAGRPADALVERLRECAPGTKVVLIGDAMDARLAEAIDRLGADGGMPVTAPDLVERLRGPGRRSADTRIDAA